jgi:hypothetical protein
MISVKVIFAGSALSAGFSTIFAYFAVFCHFNLPTTTVTFYVSSLFLIFYWSLAVHNIVSIQLIFIS